MIRCTHFRTYGHDQRDLYPNQDTYVHSAYVYVLTRTIIKRILLRYWPTTETYFSKVEFQSTFHSE